MSAEVGVDPATSGRVGSGGHTRARMHGEEAGLRSRDRDWLTNHIRSPQPARGGTRKGQSPTRTCTADRPPSTAEKEAAGKEVGSAVAVRVVATATCLPPQTARGRSMRGGRALVACIILRVLWRLEAVPTTQSAAACKAARRIPRKRSFGRHNGNSSFASSPYFFFD